MLITQNPPKREEHRLLAQIAPPIPQPSPTPTEWGNFGVAIGICVLVGNKILGLFTQQQSTETQMMLKYMEAADKREERLIRLIEVFIQQKP